MCDRFVWFDAGFVGNSKDYRENVGFTCKDKKAILIERRIMKFIFLTLIYLFIGFTFSVANDFDKNFKERQEEFDKNFETRRESFEKDFQASTDKFNKDFNNFTQISIGAFILILSFIGVIIYISFKKRKEIYKLPTVKQYLEQYPDCHTQQGIKCSYCSSKSIKNWGHTSANDSLRLHICNSCGKKLYYSEL